MTRYLYDEDAYLSCFEAKVLNVQPAADSGRYEIELDATAFFPEQGGQTADTGTLDGTVKVLDTQIRGGVVFHVCDAPLPVGAAVRGEINFAHRFSHMQQHTGEHILSGLCARTYGARNVGFHLSDRIVTVDYDCVLTLEKLDALETAANRAVWEDLPVRCWFPTPEEAERLPYRSKKEIDGRLRVVSISGVDDCACCAPHVRRTGEVGLIKIMSAARYKGGMRLSILCGQRALQAVQEKQRRLEAVSRYMTCGEDELLQVLEKRDAELKQARLNAGRLSAELLCRDAAAMRGNGGRLLRTEQADMQAMIAAAAALAADRSGPVGVFAGNDQAGYSFCLAATGDLRAWFEGFRAKTNARGGGDDRLVRGQCAAAWADIAAYFEQDGV